MTLPSGLQDRSLNLEKQKIFFQQKKTWVGRAKQAATPFVLAVCLSLFSVSSALAQTGPAPILNACDPAIRAAMQNHAEAVRVRDKAYAMQVFAPADPPSFLTCAELSPSITSLVGKIFSDTHQEPTITWNDVKDVSSGIGTFAPAAGVTVPLIYDVHALIIGSVQSMLNNFGRTVFTEQLQLDVPARSFISNWIEKSIYKEVITAFNNTTTGDYGTTRNALRRWKENNLQNFYNSTLRNLVTGCNRMARVWAAQVGAGVTPGVGFYTFEDVVNRAPMGAGARFLAELNTNYNRDILQKVRLDMNSMTPGNPAFPTYRAAPNLMASATIDDVIAAMKQSETPLSDPAPSAAPSGQTPLTDGSSQGAAGTGTADAGAGADTTGSQEQVADSSQGRGAVAQKVEDVLDSLGVSGEDREKLRKLVADTMAEKGYPISTDNLLDGQVDELVDLALGKLGIDIPNLAGESAGSILNDIIKNRGLEGALSANDAGSILDDILAAQGISTIPGMGAANIMDIAQGVLTGQGVSLEDTRAILAGIAESQGLSLDNTLGVIGGVGQGIDIGNIADALLQNQGIEIPGGVSGGDLVNMISGLAQNGMNVQDGLALADQLTGGLGNMAGSQIDGALDKIGLSNTGLGGMASNYINDRFGLGGGSSLRGGGGAIDTGTIVNNVLVATGFPDNGATGGLINNVLASQGVSTIPGMGGSNKGTIGSVVDGVLAGQGITGSLGNMIDSVASGKEILGKTIGSYVDDAIKGSGYADGPITTGQAAEGGIGAIKDGYQAVMDFFSSSP